MIQNKIDKKYSPLIWIGCFLAGFVANIYSLYSNCLYLSTVDASRLEVLKSVFIMLVSYGIFPTLITFFLAYITYMSAFRRGLRFISRSDFCLLVMATKSVSFFITGLIDVFSFLDSGVSMLTSTLVPVVIDFTCMALLFFLVFFKKYNPNPNEKVRALVSYGTVYMVLLGITVVGINALILLANGRDRELIFELLYEVGYDPVALLGDHASPVQIGLSIAALVLFFAEVIAFVSVWFVLNREARKYRDPETREEYMQKHYSPFGYEVRQDVHNTFDEFGEQNNESNSTDKDDNVFDEFDI